MNQPKDREKFSNNSGKRAASANFPSTQSPANSSNLCAIKINGLDMNALNTFEYFEWSWSLTFCHILPELPGKWVVGNNIQHLKNRILLQQKCSVLHPLCYTVCYMGQLEQREARRNRFTETRTKCNIRASRNAIMLLYGCLPWSSHCAFCYRVERIKET